MNAQMIFQQSELALAAYANLNNSALSAQKASLKDAGLSDVQADTLASQYAVLAQYNDTVAEGGMGASFSATVFKDTSGNLTLAIRGTAELTGSPNDLTTDSSIFASGAGYDQIVGMYNWWLRASTPTTGTVLQYKIVPGPLDPHDGIQFGIRWLQILPPVAGTGDALVAALNADPDHKLHVTGHSLGGHLAMAFGALFPSMTSQVTTFNAPGFTSSATNQTFFSALGGSVPSGVVTTNVIADEATLGTVPWSAIAGWNSRPGTAIDISVENQWQSDEPNSPSAKNHSQQTLTDALAVYSMLSQIDSSLTTSSFKAILGAAMLGTAASLERIVDAVEKFLGINSVNMPIGNLNRDSLYQALYAINTELNSGPQPQRSIVSLVALNAADLQSAASNPDGLATRYALKELNPFAIIGDDSLYTKFNTNHELDLYDTATGQGNLTEDWLQNRASMLTYVIAANLADTSRVENLALQNDWYYPVSYTHLTLPTKRIV